MATLVENNSLVFRWRKGWRTIRSSTTIPRVPHPLHQAGVVSVGKQTTGDRDQDQDQDTASEVLRNPSKAMAIPILFQLRVFRWIIVHTRYTPLLTNS